MGNIPVDACIFTQLPAVQIINDRTGIEYTVVVNGVNHHILISDLLNPKDPFIQKNANILFGLLWNNDWFEDEKTVINLNKLVELLKSKNFPQSPQEKIERLFINLFNSQREDGKFVSISNNEYDNILWKVLYFKSMDEMNFYVNVLKDKGLINTQFDLTKFRNGRLEGYSITYEGLNYHIKLTEEGDKSNKCFVAMSYRPETKEIRSAIKNALENTGFIPILIDELNIDSDKTINDEIIAFLKKCKFCVADYTFHSPGVYFESGHALGQGKKVIYTCRKDEFEKAHFDIKPLQHIVYETPEELAIALIHKIEAWIK